MIRRKSLGVGSVSLILIFCVLCLTIFSLLTLSSARSENELVLKLSQSVENYYEADLTASRAYMAVHSSLSKGEFIESAEGLDIIYSESDEGVYASFRSPIDENRSIAVLLLFENGKSEILQWYETDNENWSPDLSLPVLFSKD